MKVFQIGSMSLLLALCLGMNVGCTEQEQKSKAKGKAIANIVKDAEKNVGDAVLKMQENIKKFDDVEN